MKVSRFIFNMFGVNTYVLWDPESLEAAIVDPGMSDGRVTHLINTHSHLDHIFGNAYVKEKYGLKIKAHPEDEFLATDLPNQAKRFGIQLPLTPQRTEVELHDGDTLFLGKERIEIISVPGHSPGSIALYCPESNFVITGDALFAGSIGRTDLPKGNQATLIDSIQKKLMTLPDSTVILPGHGGESTIGREKLANPFI